MLVAPSASRVAAVTLVIVALGGVGYGAFRLLTRPVTSRPQVRDLLRKRYGDEEGERRLTAMDEVAARRSEIGQTIFWQKRLEDENGTTARRLASTSNYQTKMRTRMLDSRRAQGQNDFLAGYTPGQIAGLPYAKIRSLFGKPSRERSGPVVGFAGRLKGGILVTVNYPYGTNRSIPARPVTSVIDLAPPLDTALPREVTFDFLLTETRTEEAALARLGFLPNGLEPVHARAADGRKYRTMAPDGRTLYVAITKGLAYDNGSPLEGTRDDSIVVRVFEDVLEAARRRSGTAHPADRTSPPTPRPMESSAP